MTAGFPTRRFLIGTILAFALTAPGWSARADRVIVAPQLPMTVLELAKIGDDENAVMDALTYMLWRAPSMEGIVSAAPFTLKLDKNSLPVQYSMSFDNIDPFSFGIRIDRYVPPPVIDKLAILFACEIVNAAGGAHKNAINAEALDEQLRETTQSQAAINESNGVYDALMMATRSQSLAGSVAFHQYANNPGVWGPELAELMVSDGFIITVLARPLEAARHELLVMRYKLQRLSPDALPRVFTRWRAPELGKTVFPLATRDPWPPNYLYELYKEKKRPMQSLIQRAMNVATTVKVGKHCRVLRRKCDPVYGELHGEAVWDMLIDKAGPLGLLVNPQYPPGL